jgi:hypothetical protein
MGASGNLYGTTLSRGGSINCTTKNGHVGSAEIGAKMPTEVNLLCPNPLLLIALHSRHALLKTGLRLCHPEKSRDRDALHRREVRSLQSGLSRKNREIRACFAHFAGNRGRNSLLFRLGGGAEWIRTLGPVSAG